MITRSGAGLILYDKDKKILLQHRASDAPNFPDYWGVFGGAVEKGETPEEAMRRELLEEIEYKTADPKLLYVEEYDKGNIHFVNYYFIDKYDQTQSLVQHEGQGYGWFNVSEALKLKITKNFQTVLLKTQEFLENL